ncbi:MAG TPA: APC family permease [Chloroflexota bacterium]|nr:APC family permease [Chloroflexota bacterium]
MLRDVYRLPHRARPSSRENGRAAAGAAHGGAPTAATPRPPTNGAASIGQQSAGAGRILVGTEGEWTTRPGTHTGDRRVRIIRPRLPGLRASAPGVLTVDAWPAGSAPLGRAWRVLKWLLVGAPIRSAQEVHERLTRVKALAVFGSDNISSSAYATEEIMRVLLLAGAGALALTMPLTVAIVVLLAIVVASYQQTIRAYPSGGGSYIVASGNLGTVPGLIAGAALLIDYVLTVAVSTSAGVAAVTSAFPPLYPQRVVLCVVAIAVLTMGNLRGIRESGTLFAAPLYLYLVAMLGLLAFGLFRWLTGTLPTFAAPAAELHGTGQALGLFLLLRAFSSGAVALTGVEAVSNGIPAFKPPESRNARIVLIWMGTLFAAIFLGMSFLAGQVGLVPDPTEEQTVVSQLTRTLVGSGWYYYLVQLATTVLLILAANTSFADFPRLASIMARDRFLPRQFTFRGDRLAFSNGIVVLATVAGVLVVSFQGSVTALIPLYTVGVFVAFTLSQAGMVRHHWRRREPGWQHALIVNALGALATFVVAVVVGVTKFALGAWMVLVLIPLLVLLLLAIRRHYRNAEDQLVVTAADLRTRPELDPSRLQHVLVIPVADLNLAAAHAVAYARSLTGEVDHSGGAGHTRVVAVHVTDDVAAGEALKARWDRAGLGVELVVLESPYRALVEPLLQYVDALERQHPDGTVTVTVLLPEYIPAHWWEHLLHTQTALRLKGALLFRPRTAVASVPYHLQA